MYTKPQGRYPHSLRVPENYSGNAFPPSNASTVPTPSQAREAPPAPNTERTLDAIPSPAVEHEFSAPPPPPPPSEEKASPTGAHPAYRPRFGLSSLFSRFGKDGGMEELLIIGLILLLAEDGKNDDLILLLILLLFVQ